MERLKVLGFLSVLAADAYFAENVGRSLGKTEAFLDGFLVLAVVEGSVYLAYRVWRWSCEYRQKMAETAQHGIDGARDQYEQIEAARRREREKRDTAIDYDDYHRQRDLAD